MTTFKKKMRRKLGLDKAGAFVKMLRNKSTKFKDKTGDRGPTKKAPKRETEEKKDPVTVHKKTEENGFTLLIIDDVKYKTKLTNKYRDRKSWITSSKGETKSPMTGIAIKIMKSAGDKVKRGESLLIIESMKMHNRINSQVDGTITKVCIENQQHVTKGDLLVIIEVNEK